MLIKDVTFLKDSQPFDIDSREQKRVDLVLVKLIPPQRIKKIQPSFFFMNTSQKIFSTRHTKPSQLKCFERLIIINGRTIPREIIFYGKSRPTAKVAIFCNHAIYGTVQNPITKSPIFNVNILLYPLKRSQPLVSTMSNASGDYLIESLPAGAYQIMACKQGYYTFRAKFTIVSNHQFNAINMQLFPKSIMNCKKEKPKNNTEGWSMNFHGNRSFFAEKFGSV
jgi:hypothetical protein